MGVLGQGKRMCRTGAMHRIFLIEPSCRKRIFSRTWTSVRVQTAVLIFLPWMKTANSTDHNVATKHYVTPCCVFYMASNQSPQPPWRGDLSFLFAKAAEATQAKQYAL